MKVLILIHLHAIAVLICPYILPSYKLPIIHSIIPLFITSTKLCFRVFLKKYSDDKKPPAINGVESFEITDWQENMYALACNLAYSNINLPIFYTGSFLIGDTFINELYVHIGFQHPFKYKYLEEFVFENGVCIETKDLLKEAKEKTKFH